MSKLSYNVDPKARFWSQVSKHGPVHPKYGRCWVKPGRLFWYTGIRGKQVRATRYSWELHYGTIPVGLEVCHKCDNPACVRPEHLFVATHKKNMEDMVVKGRARGGVCGPNNSSTKYPELRQGRNNGNSKLSDEKVVSLRADWNTGNYTYQQLSYKYDVSIITVNRIVNHRSWKHLK